jgi:hypothetical protein
VAPVAPGFPRRGCLRKLLVYRPQDRSDRTDRYLSGTVVVRRLSRPSGKCRRARVLVWAFVVGADGRADKSLGLLPRRPYRTPRHLLRARYRKCSPSGDDFARPHRDDVTRWTSGWKSGRLDLGGR